MTKETTRAFIARLAQSKAEAQRGRHARIEANRLASEPILADLRGVGFDVEWIADLRHLGRSYDAAIPILVNWLPLVKNVAVKEDIVRCLSLPSQKRLAPVLIGEYRKVEDDASQTEDLRNALANGIEILSDETLFEEVADLVQDQRMGGSRRFLALALGKMKDPRAVTILMDLLDENDMRPFALESLGRLQASEARTKIGSFATSDVQEVAKAAQKALARIERAKSSKTRLGARRR